MQIVRDLAGYSLGRSDLVRRAMSKKKHKVMEEERRNFIHGIIDEKGNIQVPGCIRNGISEEAANKIFDQMMDFASYAFVKPHAAAYAVVGYQTAYLMRYYAAEFIAAMLNSVMGINEKVAFYIRFAETQGIQVLPPDINESYAKFTVKDEKTIRFGLASIKNAGFNVIEAVVKSREEKGKFKNLFDFCSKVETGILNKRVVESLIKAGALDSFKIYRSQMLAVYEKMLDGLNSERKRNIDGQLSLFGGLEETQTVTEIKYPGIGEFDKKYLLAMEKEMTGLYLSGHPLDEYAETLKLQCEINIGDILAIASNSTIEDEVETVSVDSSEIITQTKDTGHSITDGTKVVLGGIIAEVSKKFTKNNDMMAFITLEDLYGSIEAIIFPKVMQKVSSLIAADQLILIKGRISIREDEAPKVLCEDIQPLVKINTTNVYVLVEDDKTARDINKVLKQALFNFRGNTPIYLCTRKERKKYRLDREFWVDTDSEVLEYLRKQFGEENVKLL
jgi:DNA polymerase III subunit alpha